MYKITRRLTSKAKYLVIRILSDRFMKNILFLLLTSFYNLVTVLVLVKQLSKLMGTPTHLLLKSGF